MTDCNRLKPLTQLQIDLPENICEPKMILSSCTKIEFVPI